MTDSPPPGLSTSRATGAGARTSTDTTRAPPGATRPFSSPPRIACAVRRWRQGPPAAARSTLPGRSWTPTPHPGALNNRRRTAKERSKTKEHPVSRVDRTRSFRNDCQALSGNVQPAARVLSALVSVLQGPSVSGRLRAGCHSNSHSPAPSAVRAPGCPPEPSPTSWWSTSSDALSTRRRSTRSSGRRRRPP